MERTPLRYIEQMLDLVLERQGNYLLFKAPSGALVFQVEVSGLYDKDGNRFVGDDRRLVG